MVEWSALDWLDLHNAGSAKEVIGWIVGLVGIFFIYSIPTYERVKFYRPGSQIFANNHLESIRFHLWDETVSNVEIEGFQAVWEPSRNEIRILHISRSCRDGKVKIQTASGQTYYLTISFGFSPKEVYIVDDRKKYFRCRLQEPFYAWPEDVLSGYLVYCRFNQPCTEAEELRAKELLQKLENWLDLIKRGVPVRSAAYQLGLPMVLIRWFGYHGVIARNFWFEKYREKFPNLLRDRENILDEKKPLVLQMELCNKADSGLIIESRETEVQYSYSNLLDLE